jgi:hypothetical protein
VVKLRQATGIRGVFRRCEMLFAIGRVLELGDRLDCAVNWSEVNYTID